MAIYIAKSVFFANRPTKTIKAWMKENGVKALATHGMPYSLPR